MLVEAALNAVPNLTKAGWKALVPLGVGAVAAAGAATKGIFDVSNGRKARKQALSRLDAEIAACELARLQTDAAAHEYGAFMLDAHRTTVGRLADWLERNEHIVKRLNFKKVDGVRIRIPNIPKYAANVGSIQAGIGGIVAAVGASASAPAAALWGVSTFASASTGTAISSLSGMAAQNAALAWLGGGALAMGGGGIAAGSAVLGAITILPTLLIGGFTMGIVGARSKTKSGKFIATTNLEIERLGLARALLVEVERRIDELQGVLAQLSDRATIALDNLESVDFVPALHASEFLRAYQLVTAIKEVVNTPILDPGSGELTEASIEILRKYA